MPQGKLCMDIYIPTSNNNGAIYNINNTRSDGGYRVTAGLYYTWNVSNSNVSNAFMQVLETNFEPKVITIVTRSPATLSRCTQIIISITTLSAPSAGEYVHVQYTINGYVNSFIVQASFVGNVGTAIIPASASSVSYYVYSSNKIISTIDTDVGNHGQAVHDMSTLNLNNYGGSNYSYTIGLPTGNWTGLTNTEWSTTTNWCDSIVPAVGTNVIIPADLSNYPQINNAGALCNNISIANGASLTIINAGALSTAGNFDNLGTFTNNGLIKLNGSIAQTFPGAGIINPINNIEIDKTTGVVSCNNSFSITGLLIPTSGSVALGNSVITLKSDANNTARVSTLGATAGFTYGSDGGFLIERYLRALKSWRLLATPLEIASSPSITASWREGEAVGTNTVIRYGTRITGPVGMDEFTQRYSMKSYNGNTNSYYEINTPVKLAGPIANKEGYYIFVR